MIVEQYTSHGSLITDPSRAEGAVFRVNNAAYLVQSIRLAHNETTGEPAVQSISAQKFDPITGSFGRASPLTSERFINALCSPAFPFDPYALYNRFTDDQHIITGAGFLRRRRHAYSRFTASNTVHAFTVRQGRSVVANPDTVEIAISNEGGEARGTALCAALLSLYPSPDKLFSMTVPYLLDSPNSMQYAVAISPRAMLQILSLPDGRNTIVGNMYARDTGSPSPTAYNVCKVVITQNDRKIRLFSNGSSGTSHIIEAINEAVRAAWSADAGYTIDIVTN
jgi:hypothetical protein